MESQNSTPALTQKGAKRHRRHNQNHTLEWVCSQVTIDDCTDHIRKQVWTNLPIINFLI